MPNYKKILCPVDFSSFSDAAVQEAAGLALSMGAQMCLLHAYQSPTYVLPMSGYVGPTAEIITGIRQQLARELEAQAEPYRAQGLKVETLVIEGPPYRCIIEYAKEWGADLVVTGTHGRTGLSHALTGSVAERVVRMAPCPVLVTRLAA